MHFMYKLIIKILGNSLLDVNDRAASRSSLDSHEAIKEDNSFFEKFRKVASIVKGNNFLHLFFHF